MKRTHYVWAIVIIILLVIVVVIVSVSKGSSPTSQNSPAPSAGQAAPSSVPPVGSTAPSAAAAVSAGSLYQIHVKPGSDAWVYYAPTTTVADMIKVYSPPSNTTIDSPLTLSGLARGSWYFEGTAPVLLTDLGGKILARATIHAQSDWTTDKLVPFLGKMTYPRQPSGSTGVIVFRNDNPSGLAANDKSVEILVTFH